MTIRFLIPMMKRGPGRNGRRHQRRRRTSTAASSRCFVPRFEALEDRTLLSTFSVLNLDDAGDGSLRQAILDANERSGPDVIRFAPRLAGTITLSGELRVTDDLRIDGPGAARITVSGGGTTRVFAVSGEETAVLIEGLTIAHGLTTATATIALGGGILNTGASLTLDDVIMVGNRASGIEGANAGGGGVANVLGGTLIVTQSSFQGNEVVAGAVASYGGAIFNDAGSTLTVERCSFIGNQATGALRVADSTTPIQGPQLSRRPS